LKVGFHMSIAKGFDWIFNESKRLGCEVIQIFVKNPRSWRDKQWTEEDIESFKKLSKIYPVFAHLSYLPNLAKIDEDEKHMTGFFHEVESCGKLGIHSMVVHCGSREDANKGTIMVAEAVNRVLEKHEINILLENASGQGNSIGRQITELAGIYRNIKNKEKTFLCLDTAHLFQSGYDISNAKGWNRIVAEIERYFGKNRIVLLHLNDSRTDCGSRVDRHWHIGKGRMGMEAFRIILSDKRFAHLHGVMETPKMGRMDEKNMRVMKSLLSPLVSRSSS